MSISATQVRELRDKTGAGMMDCKKALQEASGDFDSAIEWLRKKGLSSASKKSGRVATEGLINAYIHGEGRIGVLLEVNCETDFVAKNENFKEFVGDIAMHIAAMGPLSVKEEDIPAEVINKEREFLIAKNKESGKPDNMIDKIVQGQIKKWVSENCLLEQKFVKNPDMTISTYLKETIAKIGENIVIRRFLRYELGEGLEKKSENFADEVAAQIKGS